MEVKIGLERSLSKSRAEIAGKNFIKNSRFSGSINGWSASGVLATELKDGGLNITGVGYLYQSLNIVDVSVGVHYQLSAYIDSITTGTGTVNIGTTAIATDIATQTLITGWNLINFVAGATTFVSFNGSDATTIISIKEVKIEEEVDFKVSGTLYQSSVAIGQNWRQVINAAGNLESQKLVNGTWQIAQTLSVLEAQK